MTTLTEQRHAGEFLVSEANGHRSRGTGVLAVGQNLQAGTVLGKIISALTASAVAGANNAGDGTVGAITVAGASAGAHVLTFIEPEVDAGTFQVESPSGENLGTGNVGTEFTGGGLTFTVSDGAADFVAGDQFTITVNAGSGSFTQLDPAAGDGSQVAVACLFAPTNATDAAKSIVLIEREAEVNGAEITWPDGITEGELATALGELATKSIVVR